MLRIRQKLGKYRILGRIASGPIADVYKAADTILGTRVALKIPKTDDITTQEDFVREVRIAARLDFAIEPMTRAAIEAHAADVEWVSEERIGSEVRRMLAAPTPSRAVELMAATGILATTLPELEQLPADATRRAGHQYMFVCGHVRPVKHVFCRTVGTGDRAKLGIAPAAFDREDLSCAHFHKLRECTIKIGCHPTIFQ